MSFVPSTGNVTLDLIISSLPDETWSELGIPGGSWARRLFRLKDDYYDVNLMWLVLRLAGTGNIEFEPGDRTYESLRGEEADAHPDLIEDASQPAIGLALDYDSLIVVEGSHRIKAAVEANRAFNMITITPSELNMFRLHPSVTHEIRLKMESERQKVIDQIKSIGGPTVSVNRERPPFNVPFGIWVSQGPFLMGAGFLIKKNRTFIIKDSKGVFEYLQQVAELYGDLDVGSVSEEE